MILASNPLSIYSINLLVIVWPESQRVASFYNLVYRPEYHSCGHRATFSFRASYIVVQASVDISWSMYSVLSTPSRSAVSPSQEVWSVFDDVSSSTFSIVAQIAFVNSQVSSFLDKYWRVFTFVSFFFWHDHVVPWLLSVQYLEFYCRWPSATCRQHSYRQMQS